MRPSRGCAHRAPGDVTRRDLLLGAAAVAAAGAARDVFAANTRDTRTAGTDSVVETTFGKVRGERGVGGGYKFLCVPYGASTAGEGRFMPPKPPAPRQKS